MKEFMHLLQEADEYFNKSDAVFERTVNNVSLLNDVALNGISSAIASEYKSAAEDIGITSDLIPNMFTTNRTKVCLEYATESFSKGVIDGLKKAWELFWKGIEKTKEFFSKLYKKLFEKLRSNKGDSDSDNERRSTEKTLAEINRWIQHQPERRWIAEDISRMFALKDFLDGDNKSASEFLNTIAQIDDGISGTIKRLEGALAGKDSELFKDSMQLVRHRLDELAFESDSLKEHDKVFINKISNGKINLTGLTGRSEMATTLHSYMSKLPAEGKPITTYDYNTTMQLKSKFEDGMLTLSSDVLRRTSVKDYQNISKLMADSFNIPLVNIRKGIATDASVMTAVTELQKTFKRVLRLASDRNAINYRVLSLFIDQFDGYVTILKNNAPEAK